MEKQTNGHRPLFRNILMFFMLSFGLLCPILPAQGQEQKIRTHFFWKMYGVSYDAFYPLKKDGTLDCYLGVPNHILTAYNKVVFDYLDMKFGNSWRKVAPKGIFGLDKSLDESCDDK